MALRGCLILLLLVSGPAFAKKSTRHEMEKRIEQLELFTKQKLVRERRALDRWLSSRQGRMPKASNRLLKAYYYLGTLHAQLYAHHSFGEESRRDLDHYQRARYYLGAAVAYEHEIDKAEVFLESLEQIRSKRKKLISKSRWRALGQYMSYQELALLKDSAGEEKIYSPQRGVCLGGQWAYGNPYYEWTVDGCAFLTSGNVAAENTARYSQDNVTSKGLLLKPTYWKLLSEGEAGIGFGVPVMLRKVDYTEPSGTTVESRRAIPFGFSLDGRWRLSPNIHFTTTTAMVDGSMLWSLGGLYEL